MGEITRKFGFRPKDQDQKIQVTDEELDARFYRTEGGDWYWLTGSGSPFDEDVWLSPKVRFLNI